MAYGVYWSVHIKKISDAWQKSAASTGIGQEDGRQEEETGGKSDNYIIKEYFGNELLYIYYEFAHEMHRSPKDWRDFFDFLKYSKAKGVLKETALATAKARADG